MGMVAHSFDSSTQWAETGGSLRIRSQLGQQSEFQASQWLDRETLSLNK